jgi:AAA family ATP:ADP antiporter
MTLFNHQSHGVKIWSAIAFMLLMTAIQMIRAMKDHLAITAGLENLHWLISLTFGAILISSYIIYRVRHALMIHTIISLTLALAVVYCYVCWEVTALAGIFYIIFSALSLLIIAQFWTVINPFSQTDEASNFYRNLVLYGTLGSVIGPVMVILSTQSAVIILAPICLLSSLVCLGIARSYDENNDNPSVSLPLDSPHKSTQSFAWFILLYSLIATYLYYLQLDIVKNYAFSVSDRMAIFGMRDFIIGMLTLIVHMLFNVSKVKSSRYFPLMPFISIWIFVGIGFFPALIPILSAVVIFRTGNFTITKPGRELFYRVRPSMSRYKSLIDAAIYRGGDLLGIWLITTLKHFNMGHLMLTISIIPLVILWFKISKKISLVIN